MKEETQQPAAGYRLQGCRQGPSCSLVLFQMSVRSELRHEHDRSLPKRALLSGWVQHGYLAVVLAWRKLAESNAEAEGHGFQTVIQPAGHFHGLCFERFGLCPVETHKRD